MLMSSLRSDHNRRILRELDSIDFEIDSIRGILRDSIRGILRDSIRGILRDAESIDFERC